MKKRQAIGICMMIALTAFASAQRSSNHRGYSLTSRGMYNRGWNGVRAYASIIVRHASAAGVDPALVAAVIKVESNGQAYCRSWAGACGLMQLMPFICSDYGVTDPFDPEQNIHAGTQLLASHMRRYHGDIRKSLAAYNSGTRHADDGSWANIAETRHYVPAVMNYYSALKGSPDWTTDHQFETPNYPVPDVQPSTIVTDGPATAPAYIQAAAPQQPSLNPIDMMVECVRPTQSGPSMEMVVENGNLDNLADDFMADFASGRQSASDVESDVAVRASQTHLRVKSIHVTSLRTDDVQGFRSAWAQARRVPGTLVGLSHGRTNQGHFWIVVTAER